MARRIRPEPTICIVCNRPATRSHCRPPAAASTARPRVQHLQPLGVRLTGTGPTGIPVGQTITQYPQCLPVQRGSAIDSNVARAERPEVDHDLPAFATFEGLDVLQSRPHEGIPSHDLLDLNGGDRIDWKQHIQLQTWVVLTHPVTASSNDKPVVILGEVDPERRRLVPAATDVQHDPIAGESSVQLDGRRDDPPRKGIWNSDIVTSFREEAHIEHVVMPAIADAAIAPNPPNAPEQEAD